MEGEFRFRRTSSYEYGQWNSMEVSDKVYGAGTQKSKGESGKGFVSLSIACDSPGEFAKDIQELSDPKNQEILLAQDKLVQEWAKKMVKLGNIEVTIDIKPAPALTPQAQGPPVNKDITPKTTTIAPKLDVRTIDGFKAVLSEYMSKTGWRVGEYGFSKKIGNDWWNVNQDKKMGCAYGVISLENKSKVYEDNKEFPDTFHDIIGKCQDILNNYQIENGGK